MAPRVGQIVPEADAIRVSGTLRSWECEVLTVGGEVGYDAVLLARCMRAI